MDIWEMLTPTKIIHSKRKSLSLIINNKAELIVRAPMKCSNKKIYEFIHKKADWILKTKQKVKVNVKQLNLSDGETVIILGNSYTICLYDKNRVTLKDETLYLPKLNTREKLVSFLKKTLRQYIEKRLTEICAKFGFTYLSISISSARTNWGSCSLKNRLHFTYKLALCPIEVIDYVIKHELTHTKVKNHSNAFYTELENICPDYKECERWLKNNKFLVDVI